jgi:hypothetical protein
MKRSCMCGVEGDMQRRAALANFWYTISSLHVFA